MFVVTPEIVDRIVDVEIANLVDRLRHYAALPGNPSGVHIRRFGAATAFVAEGIDDRFYNSVLGVVPETLEDLDAIRAFYAEHGRRPTFEIAPGRLPEAMGLALAEAGYAMVEFHAGLARAPTADDRDRSAPDVAAVDPTDADAFEAWLDVYLEGWNGPGDHASSKVAMRPWAGNAGWRFYLGYADGAPAGAAVLDLRDGTGMLGSASTVAAYRGRGVQRQLLDRRIADAARAGAALVVGGAYFGTSSMRNQQRAGLTTAFTRGIWIATTPTSA